MLDRVEKQQREVESSIQEQRRHLEAQEEDLAAMKADHHRQLEMQQVCMLLPACNAADSMCIWGFGNKLGRGRHTLMLPYVLQA